MRFRPCIDIHNGTVKQIVGGSLRDQDDQAQENFASVKNADYYSERLLEFRRQLALRDEKKQVYASAFDLSPKLKWMWKYRGKWILAKTIFI